MKKQRLVICCVMLLVILALHAGLARGQAVSAPQEEKLPDKILQFLRGSEMKKYKAPYTGALDPIPENLKALLADLYLHRFTIVRMRINHDISSSIEELIVVSDAANGEVVTYLSEGGHDAPESFKE